MFQHFYSKKTVRIESILIIHFEQQQKSDFKNAPKYIWMNDEIKTTKLVAKWIRGHQIGCHSPIPKNQSQTKPIWCS